MKLDGNRENVKTLQLSRTISQDGLLQEGASRKNNTGSCILLDQNEKFETQFDHVYPCVVSTRVIILETKYQWAKVKVKFLSCSLKEREKCPPTKNICCTCL